MTCTTPPTGAGSTRQMDGHAMNRGLTLAMTVATGLAVANNYYSQPLIGLIARDLPGTAAAYVPTATQLGYALGLFLLVPLGDMVERRGLAIGQFLLLAVALAGAAIAPNGVTLAAMSLLIGLAATAAQQIVPFAADLAAPERRGAILGTISSGAIAGVVLSRTLSGFMGGQFGWRSMFWLAVPLALAGALLMAAMLPRRRPAASIGYFRLMASLGDLWRAHPALRLATATQSLVFAAFMAFWTTMALRLQEPAIGLGAQAAGSFGLIAIVGVVTVPVIGRFVDRRGPFPAIIAGTTLTMAGWIVMGAWGTLGGLILGTALLDGASRSALIANQIVVFAQDAGARSRLNTIFIGSMFLGGAGGSAIAMFTYTTGGWSAVVVLGAGLAALATVLQLALRQRMS